MLAIYVANDRYSLKKQTNAKTISSLNTDHLRFLVGWARFELATNRLKDAKMCINSTFIKKRKKCTLTFTQHVLL